MAVIGWGLDPAKYPDPNTWRSTTTSPVRAAQASSIDPILNDLRDNEELSFNPDQQAGIDRALQQYRQEQQAAQNRQLRQPVTYLGPVSGQGAVSVEPVRTTTYSIPDRVLGRQEDQLPGYAGNMTQQREAPMGGAWEQASDLFRRQRERAPTPERNRYHLGMIMGSQAQPGQFQRPPLADQLRFTRNDVTQATREAGYDPTSGMFQWDPNRQTPVQRLPWRPPPTEIVPLPWQPGQNISRNLYLPYVGR